MARLYLGDEAVDAILQGALQQVQACVQKALQDQGVDEFYIALAMDLASHGGCYIAEHGPRSLAKEFESLLSCDDVESARTAVLDLCELLVGEERVDELMKSAMHKATEAAVETLKVVFDSPKSE